MYLFCKGACISLLAFRCNNPTYNPSYISLYGKDATAMVVVCAHWLACSKLSMYIFTYDIEYKLPKSCFGSFNWWFVSLFACVFLRSFVCLLCFYVVILNVFVFLIYSMLKWQNESVIHFVDGHPSSLNLMTFSQVFHGDYWPPCSSFISLT